MDRAAGWLKTRLNYEFDDATLLERALTHRSAPGRNNERLEFLGDAVLDAVISEVIFASQPHADEGDLSRLRSSLVKDATLASIAGELELGDHLTLGGGERKTGGHRRASILADAFEAIIGAIYLDAGFEAAQRVIHHVYGERLIDLPDAAKLRDPKTRLQEFLQSKQIDLPDYQVTDVTGKSHQQSFTVTCSVAALGVTAEGHGSSRRNAEQKAARSVLEQLAEAND